MAKKKIAEILEEILEGFLSENGYTLYNTEFVKEGKDWFLRVYVDKESDYIGTEDCEKVSRYLSEKLDEVDPIEQNYYLEVSSPGLDRPLIKPDHYRAAIGKAVEIKLYKAKDGVKNIEGVLEDFTENPEDGYQIKISGNDNKEWNLQLAEIAKARLAVIF